MNFRTRRDIDKIVEDTLGDAGIKRPPVPVEALLEHLRLHRDYYSLQDPGFLDRMQHKITVHGQKLIRILQKIKLKAVLLYDENRIVIDSGLKPLQREWPAFHEVVHRLVDWHRPCFYGDTAQTLSADWHEELEEEANYGASGLMFCGHRFTRDAKDTTPEWASVELLKQEYGKNYVPTLRRYVEHGREQSMAMLVCTPPWKERPPDQLDRVRYFVQSGLFAARFNGVAAQSLLGHVDANLCASGGRCADFTLSLSDDNDDQHEFCVAVFSNTYDLLVLVVWQRKLTATRIVAPRPIIIPGHGQGVS